MGYSGCFWADFPSFPANDNKRRIIFCPIKLDYKIILFFYFIYVTFEMTCTGLMETYEEDHI